LYYSSLFDGLDGVTVDTAAAKEEFKKVLAYAYHYDKDDKFVLDSGIDVILYEKATMTLVQWIESGFKSDI
jgi:hypothetical protein